MSDDLERRSRDLEEQGRRTREAEQRKELDKRREYRESVKNLLGDDDKRDRKDDSDDE